MKSENKNFIFNVGYQVISYIFPLITVTYISRTLGVTNVGIYSYTYSVVYMFMLVAMLGINNYGNRAIAKCRDDKETLSQTFLSIYYLQLIVSMMTILAYIIYLLFICQKYKLIALLQLIHLISVCFDINWFFFGLERFKITITRNLIIKILSIVLIFIFVRNKQDLWLYTLIMATSTLISQIYLVVQLPKIITRKHISVCEIFSHFKGVAILFIPVLAFGVYRVMDKTMIGAFSSVEELGYYENAERLINIPVAVINALGTVMLPRMSYILKDKSADYRTPIFTSMKLAMILSTMMAFGLILISNDVVLVLFGEEFQKSGGLIIVLSVTIIAAAWANVIRTQYLIPCELDKIYIISTAGGAIINLFSNLFFIRQYGAYGACIGTIAAELFVAMYQSIRARKNLELIKYSKLLLSGVLKAALCVMFAFFATSFFNKSSIRLLIEFTVAVIAFVVLNRRFIFNEFLGIK